MAEAESVLSSLKETYTDAYIKYTGQWRRETTQPSAETSEIPFEYNGNTAFYCIWCVSSKDRADAVAVCENLKNSVGRVK